MIVMGICVVHSFCYSLLMLILLLILLVSPLMICLFFFSVSSALSDSGSSFEPAVPSEFDLDTPKSA